MYSGPMVELIPRVRTFDLTIYNETTDDCPYTLEYAMGELQVVCGLMGSPVLEEIVNVLKEVGVWEK